MTDLNAREIGRGPVPESVEVGQPLLVLQVDLGEALGPAVLVGHPDNDESACCIGERGDVLRELETVLRDPIVGGLGARVRQDYSTDSPVQDVVILLQVDAEVFCDLPNDQSVEVAPTDVGQPSADDVLQPRMPDPRRNRPVSGPLVRVHHTQIVIGARVSALDGNIGAGDRGIVGFGWHRSITVARKRRRKSDGSARKLSGPWGGPIVRHRGHSPEGIPGGDR